MTSQNDNIDDPVLQKFLDNGFKITETESVNGCTIRRLDKERGYEGYVLWRVTTPTGASNAHSVEAARYHARHFAGIRKG